MSKIILLAALCLCLAWQAVVAELVEPTFPAANKPKYFLSAMVMERNQTTLLLEFVRHYLEEGVEHFFIYNSQNVPHIHHELDCIDQKYYTIIPHLGDAAKKETVRQDVYQIVRNQTQWLAIVDSDDFISSRAYPTKTIREILEGGNHAICKIISVPTINYAWGNVQETPMGDIRTSLTQRWGYEPKFNYSEARKAAKSNKFTDSYEKVKNRMIVATQHVASVRTNTAVLHSKGNICVASTQQYQSCAQFVQDVPPVEALPGISATGATATATATTGTATTTTAATHKLPVDTLSGKSSPHPVHLLPRYCPERNVFRSKRSMSSLYLQEQDIPGLSLAVHHYRIPSQREWNRLSGLYPTTYPPTEEALANRADVQDRFMLEREDHRKYHTLQKEAEKALQMCDQEAEQRLKSAQVVPAKSDSGVGSGVGGVSSAEGRTDATLRSVDVSSSPGDVKSGITIESASKSDTGGASGTSSHVGGSGGSGVSSGAESHVQPVTSFTTLVKSFYSKFIGA